MNKLKYLLPLVVFGVFSCSGKLPQVEGLSNALASPRSIVVVYENDVHCNMEGYAKFAGLRDAIADTARAMQSLQAFVMRLRIRLMS